LFGHPVTLYVLTTTQWTTTILSSGVDKQSQGNDWESTHNIHIQGSRAENVENKN